MNMFRDWDQLVFIYILNVRKYLVTEYLKLGELGCKLGSNSSRCSRQINHFRLNFIFVLACMIQYTRTRVVQHRILNILCKKYLIMNSNFCFLTQYRVLRRLFKCSNWTIISSAKFCVSAALPISMYSYLWIWHLYLPKQKTSDIHNFVKMSQRKASSLLR